MNAGPSTAGATRDAPRAAPVARVASGADESALASGDSEDAAEDGERGPVHHTNGHNRTGKVLVLNATMEPLCVVSARRAVVLVLSSKADVLHTNGHRFRSEQLDVQAPSVVRLRRFVRVPYRHRAALSRRGVFIRDEHRCQYCGRSAENVDHVVPRSRGGSHEWENVVAACRRCNARKRDQTPTEARMSLRRTPYAPRAAFWLLVSVGRVEPDWETYLGDLTRA